MDNTVLSPDARTVARLIEHVIELADTARDDGRLTVADRLLDLAADIAAEDQTSIRCCLVRTWDNQYQDHDWQPERLAHWPDGLPVWVSECQRCGVGSLA